MAATCLVNDCSFDLRCPVHIKHSDGSKVISSRTTCCNLLLRCTSRICVSFPPLENQDGQQKHHLPLVRRHCTRCRNNFYAATFPNSAVGAVYRAPSDYPSGNEGDVMMVEFTVMGIPCLGLNGGPAFTHNEAFSFQVATDDQAETDLLWNAIVGNGGQESACGWCKDRWGVSWQITPRALTAAVTDPDQAAAKCAFEAMMGMRKIDIAVIEAARRG